MTDFKKIFQAKKEIMLSNIDTNNNISNLLIDNKAPKEVRIEVKDRFEILDNNKEAVILRFTRELVSGEGGPFDISISFDVIHFYLNEPLDDETLKKEIDNNIDYFRCDIMAKISLLISQITYQLSGVNTPIITPPIFIK